MKTTTTTKFEASLKAARSELINLESQASSMLAWEACPCEGHHLSAESEREVRKDHMEGMLDWVAGVRAEYCLLYAFVQREEGRTRPRGLTHPSGLYFRWVR
jgi:hypothetical protein